MAIIWNEIKRTEKPEFKSIEDKVKGVLDIIRLNRVIENEQKKGK